METWFNKKNGFFVIKLHYSADDRKRTVNWKSEASRGVPEDIWEQEYELNFQRQKGKKVFTEFSETTHCKSLQPVNDILFLRGWDFGYHRPACVLTQINTADQWCIIREWLGKDTALETFAQGVLSQCPRGDGIRYKDYCDPAGTQSSDKSVRTSIDILNALNIHPIYKKSAPEMRAGIIRSLLLKRSDGEPGLLLNKSCKMLTEGFLGGYHYPENLAYGEKETPLKDGFYDHLFDALGYIAYSVFKYSNPEKKKNNRFVYSERRYNDFTGS